MGFARLYARPRCSTAFGTRSSSPHLPLALAEMFKSCNNFTISGGTFHYTVTSQTKEEDFRRIRLGDIHLVKCLDERVLIEYHPEKRGRIGQRPVVVGVRRMYRANIFGSQAPFTVVAYEGPGAEARQRQALDMQVRLPRRPHLMQLFGVTTTPNFSALTYHGDLIPCKLVFLACTSHLNKTIFWYLFQLTMHWSFLDDCSIVMSTGAISVEVGPHKAHRWKNQLPQHHHSVTLKDCMEQDSHKLMDRLAVDDVLNALSRWSSSKLRKPSYPQDSIIYAGTVYHTRGGPKTLTSDTPFKTCSFRIAKVDDDWETTKFLKSTRPDYSRVKDLRNLLHPWGGLEFCIGPTKQRETELVLSWLSRANTIFCAGNVQSEDFFLTIGLVTRYRTVLSDCDITLRGTFMADDAPTEDLYLFLKRPRKYLQDGGLAIELPFDLLTGQLAYFWSIHPDGREPLTATDLDKYYPPRVKSEIEVWGYSWSEEKYQLIADVMRLRGYDPTTRDYAREHGMLEPI
ncbi:hypothetical protein C8F01DRAFT_1139119, partial [Mycena amicta]